MPLRRATDADARPLAELWVTAFPDRRTVEDRVRQLRAGLHYGGLEDAWIAERDGRLAGALRAYRMTEHLAGARLPMLGLAAVAVAPEWRRRGVAGELCREAIRIGRERGDVVSVLYPFRPDFYRALGWGYVGALELYRFRASALAATAAAGAVRRAGREDEAAVAACYARVAAASHGPIERSPAVWRHRLGGERRLLLVHERAGETRGYLLASGHKALRAGGATLSVRELVAEDDEAYEALLGFLAAQGDQWPLIEYAALPGERLDHRLADPRPPRFREWRELWHPTARRLRGPMLRLLDAPRALESRRWGAGPPLALRIEVEDPEVPENRGPFALRIERGRATLAAPGDDGGPDDVARAELACDAATLAQVWAGELAPTAAARLGLARLAGAQAALDAACAVPRDFWLPDGF